MIRREWNSRQPFDLAGMMVLGLPGCRGVGVIGMILVDVVVFVVVVMVLRIMSKYCGWLGEEG